MIKLHTITTFKTKEMFDKISEEIKKDGDK